MVSGSSVLSEIAAVLEPQGIFVRGVVSFHDGNGPSLSYGSCARTVVLLGNIGGSIWRSFDHWRTSDQGPDPLDTWSRVAIDRVAGALGATALYPSDQPWQPFQRWATQAEGLAPSPLGILIHPRFGLWHGYRGALAFAEDLGAAPVESTGHPCTHCIEKPCLATCPAGALAPTGFAVNPCRSYLDSDGGRATCMANGCAARNACPVGADFRYSAEQLRFHMAAL
ncbi:hypothetical protein ABID21_001091 [Pseudorhizobium tarimense]|uniref:4Fe-4S ferredoxin-type domain-containing protein n=1 Tax=Pseudorhizobium tarimense TaxID=1079109 RepID=A0ABV2H377_9HYPH|nr:ferredoxin [Pseudorhizobium tarimense]MCJ8518028.1 ferredoxin [Pseudorhizobium tarimense]